MKTFCFVAICLIGMACGASQVTEVTTSNVFGVSGFGANASALTCNGVAAARASLMGKSTQMPLVVRFEFTPTFLLGSGIPAGSRLLSYELFVMANVSSVTPRVTLQRSNTTLQYPTTQYVATSGSSNQEMPAITTTNVRVQPTANWNNVAPTGDGATATLNSINDAFKIAVTLTFVLEATTSSNVFLDVDCCRLLVTHDSPESPRTTSTARPTTTTSTTTAATTTTVQGTTTTTTRPTTTMTTTAATTTTTAATTTAAATTTTTPTSTRTTTTTTPMPSVSVTTSISMIVAPTASAPSSTSLDVVGGPSDSVAPATDAQATTSSTSILAVSSTGGVSSSDGIISTNAPIVSEPADPLGIYIGIGIGACLLLSGIIAVAVIVSRKRKRRTMTPPPEEDHELTSRPQRPNYSAAPTITDIAPVISHYGTAPRLPNNSDRQYDVGLFETQKV